MLKIVFDADGLIKLAHTGILAKVNERCLISNQVFNETVVEGKKRLYPDALIIEDLIKQQKMIVQKVIVKKIEGYGIGEISTLTLFMKEKADVIVSDDRKFLVYLDNLDVPFIIPTEFIVGLAMSNRITKEDGREALKNIKSFVRLEQYTQALHTLGGKI